MTTIPNRHNYISQSKTRNSAPDGYFHGQGGLNRRPKGSILLVLLSAPELATYGVSMVLVRSSTGVSVV